MHCRLSLSRLLMEILRWTCSQLQHWLWITGGIVLVNHLFQSKSCRVDEDSDSECGDLEGQLALPGAFFLAFHTTMFVQNFFDHIWWTNKINVSITGVGESSGEEDSLDLEPWVVTHFDTLTIFVQCHSYCCNTSLEYSIFYFTDSFQ